MKDAHYEVAAPVARAIEAMRAKLETHCPGYTFIVAVQGKVIASANQPLAGGTLKARPIPE